MALSIAIRRFLYPVPIHHAISGLLVVVVSIVATLGLMIYQRRRTALTGSLAVAADRTHHESDLLGNVAVVLSLVGAGIYGLDRLDPLIGAALAAYLLVMAFRSGRDGVRVLLERPLPLQLQERIEAVALATDGVLAIDDLRTREAGHDRFVECHIEVRADLSISAARMIADRLEAELEELLPGTEVIVQPTPALPDQGI